MSSSQIVGVAIMSLWLAFLVYLALKINFNTKISAKALYAVLQNLGCIGRDDNCRNTFFRHAYHHDEETGKLLTYVTCDKCGAVYDVCYTKREARVILKGKQQ